MNGLRGDQAGIWVPIHIGGEDFDHALAEPNVRIDDHMIVGSRLDGLAHRDVMRSAVSDVSAVDITNTSRYSFQKTQRVVRRVIDDVYFRDRTFQ